MVRVEQRGQSPEVAPVSARGAAETSQLLIDRFLPRWDLAVAHAGVFRAPPQACYQAACGLDVFRVPLIRTRIDLRGLPPRLVGAVTGHRTPAAPAQPRSTELVMRW